MYLLIGFVVVFIVLFVILFFQNRQELVTFDNLKNDLHPPPRQPSSNGPIVYQLVYSSSSGQTWTFLMNNDFYSDWKTKKTLNYLLINGTLYKIKDQIIDNDKTIMKFKLEANCQDSSATSFVGSSCTQASWPTNTTLLVLGYYFAPI